MKKAVFLLLLTATLKAPALVESSCIDKKLLPYLCKIVSQQTHDDDIKNRMISETVKVIIDGWIKKNNLNQYGDPQGTCYMGGSPLFDEMTGEIKDRYVYILENHLVP